MQKTGQLVKVTTQHVSKAIPITDSLRVSEVFNKKHNVVLRDIRKLELTLSKSLNKTELDVYKFEQMYYEDKHGRKQPFYNMNRDFFNMLVMGYNTKNAIKYKHKFLMAFNLMESELMSKVETRHIALTKRKELTDVIKNNVIGEGNFKNFAYSNYTRLINKLVLGMTVKKFKEKYDIPEGENVRDYISIEKLEKIHDLESKIAELIQFNDNITDKELYAKIKDYFNNKEVK